MQILCIGDIAFIEDDLSEWDALSLNGLIPSDEIRILFNWELPIGEKINPIPRVSGPRLLSNPRSPRVIRKWAPGIAALANNHVLDAAEEGLSNTITELRNNGFTTLGAGTTQIEISRPFIWQTVDGRLAILNWVFPETNPDINCIPGPNFWPGIEVARQCIQDLKREVDWVMVFAHWSDELFPYPRPEDRIIARELVDAGIDVLVGHHPHVVRGMELINNCPVFYSLGNYYFRSNSPQWEGKVAPRNRESLVIEILFKPGLPPICRPYSFWQIDSRVIEDPKNRAVKRMEYTSRPLNRYVAKEYEEWHRTERERFDKVWMRWHFGIRRLGILGSIRRLLQKFITATSLSTQ